MSDEDRTAAPSPEPAAPAATAWWSRPVPAATPQPGHGEPPASPSPFAPPPQAPAAGEPSPYSRPPAPPSEPYQAPAGSVYASTTQGMAPGPGESTPSYGGAPASFQAPASWGGAGGWGAPVDTLGQDPARGGRSGRRRRAVALGGAGLALALIGGVTGGLIGASRERDSGLLDPSASLGTGSSAQVVDRAPDSVAGIAAKVLKSTVSIQIRFGENGGNGSGVVLRSDGYVLTNNHVVEDAATNPRAQITVASNEKGGIELPATIVGRDPDTDLAVLKISSADRLVPATLGQSGSLVAGDPVIAIGSPLGYAGTVTSGIISGLNRTVRVPGDTGRSQPLFNAIQTDASINPGNSGGALVDGRGQVIGINTAIASLGGGGGAGAQGGSIGVGFAIPIDEARSVAEELIRTGRATHPAIGVEALTVTGGEGAGGDSAGARVQNLVAGGPAQAAGIRPGDLIVKVDKAAVASVDELIVEIRRHKIGERVPVTYIRGGQTGTAQVVLTEKQPVD